MQKVRVTTVSNTQNKKAEPPIRFGTGGWRGIIGDDFIKANIRRVAYGICLLANAEHKTDKPIVIGYDRRFLSETASRWIAEVMTALSFAPNTGFLPRPEARRICAN